MGIPFAAPPIGPNRWRAPQPAPDWDGVLEAFQFGPIAMQATPGINKDNIYDFEWHVDPHVPMGEDCLHLNVWTPATSPEDRLPVFVWFFGGGLQVGYPSEMEFDGERIARRGVVVVTINYRLNVFGFLCHPEITKEAPEAPANFGHLDQQNEVLMRLGIIKQPIMFLGIPALFWWIIGVSHVWKEVGWGAIIYLAAIAAIDPTLYESAMIDGAGRLKQMWYITLPSIRPTISVLLIMNLGWVLSAGFEQQYLLQNGRVIDYARVFTIYELDYGIKMMRYSFATAVGIFRSVVSLILVFSANQLAKRWGQERLV